MAALRVYGVLDVLAQRFLSPRPVHRVRSLRFSCVLLVFGGMSKEPKSQSQAWLAAGIVCRDGRSSCSLEVRSSSLRVVAIPTHFKSSRST